MYANPEMLQEPSTGTLLTGLGVPVFLSQPASHGLSLTLLMLIPIVGSECISTLLWHKDISISAENQTLLVLLFMSGHL